ncbi:MAG: HYExAFE family protein [Phycisphaerales bacterium]|nr:HYExAFE family protein [Phycisphaerales bacterium]MCI0630362.1 HYExAFE family protein [Phycisphaerales bacterium]MCI0677355.1 HYExAFE family protein [Phycisphaerales bacterium]
MAQRRFHYEQAFEHFLRANRVPYVAVDEAKKALLPARSDKRGKAKADELHGRDDRATDSGGALKSFDFVVYTPRRSLLVDVKGRMFGSAASLNPHSSRRFESWVTQDDVDSLQHWQRLFGSDFEAVFVFAYCLRQQPPDALFEELFAFGERWYALREVLLDAYCKAMVKRSERWQTVHVSGEEFARISRPFSAKDLAPVSKARSCDSERGVVC